MNIITAGIDLAKNVFAVYGVDDNGKPVLVKPKVARADLLPLITQLPPCLIGMEACTGAQRKIEGLRAFAQSLLTAGLGALLNMCVPDEVVHFDLRLKVIACRHDI